jgi:hypothetical protein
MTPQLSDTAAPPALGRGAAAVPVLTGTVVFMLADRHGRRRVFLLRPAA